MYNPSRKNFRARKLELGNFGSWIFLVSSGIRQACDGEKIETVSSFNNISDKCKLGMDEKIEIVCSFNGLPITCWLEIEFFVHKPGKTAVMFK